MKTYVVTKVNGIVPGPNGAVSLPISGTPNTVAKFNSDYTGIENSSIVDDGSKVIVNNPLEINSGVDGQSGIKTTRLNNPIANSTIIGNTIGTAPVKVAKDSLGNIYVACIGDFSETGGSITKITPAGSTYLFAENLDNPTNILIDSNNNVIVNITGPSVRHVRRYVPDGSDYEVMFTTSNTFTAYGMVLDSNDNLYISTLDIANQNIFKITPSLVQSNYVDLVSGQGGDIVFDNDGNLYVLQLAVQQIMKITPSLVKSVFVDYTGNLPELLHYDKFSNNIYFMSQAAIYSVLPDGTKTMLNPGKGYYVKDMVFDSKGNLFAGLNGSPDMLRITQTGAIKEFEIAGDGPWSLTIDEDDVIHTSNRFSNNVTKVVFPYLKLLTIDDEGNFIFYDENISQQWIEDAIFDGIENLPAIDPRSIAVNDTTVELTSSDLISNYSTAQRGFKVHCMMIATGPLIYEKTDSFWVKYPATVVA